MDKKITFKQLIPLFIRDRNTQARKIISVINSTLWDITSQNNNINKSKQVKDIVF